MEVFLLLSNVRKCQSKFVFANRNCNVQDYCILGCEFVWFSGLYHGCETTCVQHLQFRIVGLEDGDTIAPRKLSGTVSAGIL